jgi:hypothetical protein
LAPRSTPSVGALVAACCCLVSAATARADVAILVRAPADADVARELAGMLDERVHVHEESAPRRVSEITRDAATWPERYVVVVDRESDSVHALRPSDQTIVSRVLPQSVLVDAHYAVALASAELLEWLGAAPRAEVAVVQDGASIGVRETAEQREPAKARSAIGFAAGAGIELSASPGYDPSLTRLAVEAGVELGRGRGPLWTWLGVRASLFGSASLGALPDTTADVRRVEYRGHDLALQGALGLGSDGAALGLGPVVGLSLIDVRASDRRGEVVGDHAQVSAFLGAGIWLRYPVAAGFGLALGAEAQWLVTPVRYRIEGIEVLEEGPFRAQTRIGLVWESS